MNAAFKSRLDLQERFSLAMCKTGKWISTYIRCRVVAYDSESEPSEIYAIQKIKLFTIFHRSYLLFYHLLTLRNGVSASR